MLELNFDPFPILETERLVLRRTTLDDAQDYFALRSNVDAMKHIAKPLQTSIEETKTLIYKINEMISFNDGISWAVCLKTDPKMIGSVSFHRIEKDHYRAEIGYMLHPSFWKQGIISEAVEAIIDYGFKQLHFHSIEAHIDPANIGSEKILKKHKFVQEAYFKENYYFAGQFLDTAVFSLINPNSR
ncbi:MAG: GNAT family N-acetyltransferase [Bacteroidetes bacterium]|nr:GNAT family N-acetyltransferase [Bacteroidota bacterium]